MSQGGRAEGMARLRRVIAQIEAEAGPAGERLAQRLSFARHSILRLAAASRTTLCMRSRRLGLRTERRRWALRWRSPRGF
jgi:hypothetical protein